MPSPGPEGQALQAGLAWVVGEMQTHPQRAPLWGGREELGGRKCCEQEVCKSSELKIKTADITS